MKRFLLLLSIIVVPPAGFASTLTEIEPEPPKIEFEENEYDFGIVPEDGKKVSYEFVFQNTGESPLVITRIITSSCKCISTSYTKKPVPPGGEGSVTVTYDPKKQQGIFYKAIQVFSNTAEGLDIIIVKGEVVKTPK